MTAITPEILIISNRHDFATDHVVFQLRAIGASYLRLNRDEFSEFRIAFFPTEQRIQGEGLDLEFEITAQSLKSIYFRAPAYLRDIYQPNISPDEQLYRTQWAAFIRGLTVYDDLVWVNHPQATYQSEIKPYQLHLAKRIGFDVPETVITNASVYGAQIANGHSEVAAKTLDAVILNIHDRAGFIYTNTVTTRELLSADISGAPIILQQRLSPKLDIRVTVIEDRVFAVSITEDNCGVEGDWRLKKGSTQCTPFDLPPEVQGRCAALVRALNLKFGAIDLALCGDTYYFLEINPTGEWAWLVDQSGLPIDKEIARVLVVTD